MSDIIILKGEFRGQYKLGPNERAWKIQKEWAITDVHAPTGSWDTEIQSHKHERHHFPDLKRNFRLNEEQ